MIPEYGDMWKMWGKTDLFIITGNASIKKDGYPVMGRGAAKEFADRFPLAVKGIGYEMSRYTYIQPYYGLLTFVIDDTTYGSLQQKFGLFQVKRWWHEKASLSIVERSTYELLALAEANKDWRIDINYPAIGNGKRMIEEIEPIISILPDNVHVWQRYRKENKMPKWGKGDPDKVRPNYENEQLDYLEIPENGSIDIRLIGSPVVWQAHWPSIWSSDGEKKVAQPMCCNKFDPESLIQNVSGECILCSDDDDLPLGITYEKDWDRGPSFRGFALCIDRTAQADGKPYIKAWGFPITVYDEIERFAQKWGNPADDEEGYDISVKKEVGDFVKYKITPEKEASPIDEEEQEMYDLMLPAFDELYMFRDDDEILERIEEIVENLDSRSSGNEAKSKKRRDSSKSRKARSKKNEDDEEDEEDEEEEKVFRPKKKKKLKAEEDEDDEEEGEDEEEEKEETPQKKKKKKAPSKRVVTKGITDQDVDDLFDDLDL